MGPGFLSEVKVTEGFGRVRQKIITRTRVGGLGIRGVRVLPVGHEEGCKL